MAKVTLSDIGTTLSESAAATINENNNRIEQALENLLSRIGTSPNQMEADIDLNSNDLINVAGLFAEQITLDGIVLDPTLKGWSPELAVIQDGSRRVFRIADWQGGTGTKPSTGQYIGTTGLVTDISLAVDVRGPAGTSGSGTGDMVASTYDPQAIEADAFDRANHTGSQAISSVTGLQDALDSKQLAYILASDIDTTTIANNVQGFWTSGYFVNGKGSAFYVRSASEPSHAGKLQSADGAWWVISPKGSIDPLQLGAVANGSTNDATILTNTATVARTFNVPIHLSGGYEYAFSTALNFGAIKGIQGHGTLKYTGVSSVSISIEGSFAAAKTLSADEPSGSSALAITGHGYSVEDWLFVRSGENTQAVSSFNIQLGDNADNSRYSEFVQIDAVTDANNVSLNQRTFWGYPQTTTETFKVTWCENPVLKEFKFDGNDFAYLQLDWCFNPVVERSVKIVNPGQAGMIVEHSIGGLIGPSVYRDANSDNSGNPASFQGIKVRDGCVGIKVSPYVQNGEQGVDVTYTPSSNMNGTCLNILVVDGTFIGINQQAITDHEGVYGTVVSRNVIFSAGDGISIRSPGGRVFDNYLSGDTISDTNNDAIRIGNSFARDSIISRNTIERFYRGVYAIGSSASIPREMIVESNKIKNCVVSIDIADKSANSIVDHGLRIRDNEIVDSVNTGIIVGDEMHGCVVSGNVVRQDERGDLGSFAIRIDFNRDVEVNNNRCVDVGASIAAIDLHPAVTGFTYNNRAIGNSGAPESV